MHYDEYVQRCQESGIEENWRCVPDAILEAREAATAKAQGKEGPKQTTLDTVVQKLDIPTAFSEESILKHVTIHIVCHDQVRYMADVISAVSVLTRPFTATGSRGRGHLPELPGRDAPEDARVRTPHAYHRSESNP